MNKEEKEKKDQKDEKEKGKTQKEQREEGKAGEGKVSVIVTVKNDPEGERKLMKALAGQTVGPDEVIIVESSNRETPWHTSRSQPIFARRIFSPGCSRGRGRNVGIRMARNEVIAVTDAGCRPWPDWLYKLYKCYKNHTRLPRPTSPKLRGARPPADSRSVSDWRAGNDGIVVAGWYRVEARTQLQRIMSYFLVPEEFYEETPCLPARSLLPASRSIMFTKKAWELVGGYPEEAASGGEDLEFARRLAAHPQVKMVYCPQAVVDWESPATLTDFFRDIVKHTRGNVEVGYWPHLIKNFTVVLRWAVFAFFPWMIPVYLGIKTIITIKDSPWRTPRTVLFIPIVQLAADAGVAWGLILGIWGRITTWDIKM